MSSRVELQPAYILHTRPYRDTSLLVDLITQDYGKVSLMAKGARKAKSHQRFLLQAFQPVLVSWQGRSSLKTLIGIELETPATETSGFRLQGDRLYSAMYSNELLVYLLPQDDPTDYIFTDYQQLLIQLSGAQYDIEPSLRCFELALLESLGYGVDLMSDADTGESLSASNSYYFVANHGFVSSHTRLDIRDISFQGQDLLAIAHRDFNRLSTRQAAKYLSRLLLKPHLRGRELKSRELFIRPANTPGSNSSDHPKANI